MFYQLQKLSKINSQNRAKYEDIHHMDTENLPKFINENVC